MRGGGVTLGLMTNTPTTQKSAVQQMAEQRAARRAVTLYLEEMHIELSKIHLASVNKAAELAMEHPNDDYSVENVRDSYRDVQIVLDRMVQRWERL